MTENVPVDGDPASALPPRLAKHGAVLFLLGLLSGITPYLAVNPRMGLAAHVVGVTGGTFLLALAATWSHVRLSGRWASAAYWLVLYGNYVNLLISLFAAATGTRDLTPNLGTSGGGSAWQEAVVRYGFMTVGVAMVAGVALIAWGLMRRGRKDPPAAGRASQPLPEDFPTADDIRTTGGR